MEDLKGGLNNIGLKYLDLDKDNLLETLAWSEKYGENGASLVSPNLSGSHILEILGYKEISGEYLDFKNKEISDIGSGLGGLGFELENSAKKINAVDPLYSSETREEILKEEINRGQNRIKWLLKLKETKNYEILELQSLIKKMPSNHNLLFDKQDLEENIIRIQENTNLSQKVLEDIKKWEERGFENSEKISLIGESGEDTKLPNDSQDCVFMTNVITKECVNPYKLLTEASRILKPGGKIIIVDEHQEVEDIFNKIGKKFKIIGNHIRVLELEKEEYDIGENN